MSFVEFENGRYAFESKYRDLIDVKIRGTSETVSREDHPGLFEALTVLIDLTSDRSEELAQLESEVKSLEEELEVETGAVVDLQDQVWDLENNLDECDTQIKELEEDNIAREEKESDLYREIVELQNRIKELEEEKA